MRFMPPIHPEGTPTRVSCFLYTLRGTPTRVYASHTPERGTPTRVYASLCTERYTYPGICLPVYLSRCITRVHASLASWVVYTPP